MLAGALIALTVIIGVTRDRAVEVVAANEPGEQSISRLIPDVEEPVNPVNRDVEILNSLAANEEREIEMIGHFDIKNRAQVNRTLRTFLAGAGVPLTHIDGTQRLENEVIVGEEGKLGDQLVYSIDISENGTTMTFYNLEGQHVFSVQYDEEGKIIHYTQNFYDENSSKVFLFRYNHGTRPYMHEARIIVSRESGVTSTTYRRASENDGFEFIDPR